MADLTLPDFYNASLIDYNDLENWNINQFLIGYLIVNCDFQFPSDVKYPSIPGYIDITTTFYPLSGSSFLTGPEYILAKRQGCSFDVKSAFYIHPKEKLNVVVNEKESIKLFIILLRRFNL